MATRSRCTECGKRFVPAPQVGQRQRVCSAECRASRCRRLARSRRLKDLEGFRGDERERKRNHRRRVAEAQAQVVSGMTEAVPGQESPKCHAPGSTCKILKLQDEIHRILDGPFRVSRARFGREQRRIERKIGSIVVSMLPESGQCGEMSRAR
jgi:hypothetical protein